MLSPLLMLNKLLTVCSQRFYKELQTCKLLSHPNVVPFVGAWSMEAHPFSLVYERMANLDLRQYLQNEPNVRRLLLVHAPVFQRSTNHLTSLVTADGSSPRFGLLA